jgi:redox-sensitive bicupin YhaK (pirin superfamily)
LADKHNRWALVASSDARAGSLKVHQDLSLYATVLAAEASLPITVSAGRCAYLHIASGAVVVDGRSLQAGDALKVDAPAALTMHAMQDSEILWFDLPEMIE